MRGPPTATGNRSPPLLEEAPLKPPSLYGKGLREGRGGEGAVGSSPSPALGEGWGEGGGRRGAR